MQSQCIKQICYAVALAMSFPLQILPAFQLVERIQIVTNYVFIHTLGRLNQTNHDT